VFYDAHFIIDVTNWSQGVWLDGTVQIMDKEDILLSNRIVPNRFVPAHLPEFPDDRCSANEGLAFMVGVAKVYDRILTLADEHGLYVGEDEFSTLVVSSGGATIGTMMVAMRRSGVELDVAPFAGEEESKRPIWDHFVGDLSRDPVVSRPSAPVVGNTRRRLAGPLTHSSRFHIYATPMGEMTFVSGEVALIEDNIETLSWEANIGVVRTEDIADRLQEMFDRLAVGASVMDRLASEADACGIALAMAGDSVIVAYFNGEIIGQIDLGAGSGGVEFTPGRLDSPDRSDAMDRAWRDFCALIRQILGSSVV
jgi:hypothetical protein